MSDPGVWRPTARLRWVMRDGWVDQGSATSVQKVPTLQQWHGPEAPSYMRDDSIGEWRDVPMGSEAP